MYWKLRNSFCGLAHWEHFCFKPNLMETMKNKKETLLMRGAVVIHVGWELILKEMMTSYSTYFSETSGWGFPPHCKCIILTKHHSLHGGVI